MRPPILILHASGTNRDRDAARACELAGGAPEIVHVNQVANGERHLLDYRMLVIPGGFSYGDDLGAGKLWAVALQHRIGDEIAAFVAAKRPILGICNGFQTLVKAGLLPGLAGPADRTQVATLTRNESARFECRWVHLRPEARDRCVFTRGIEEPIHCPVAHGEGRFVARDAATLAAIEQGGLVALRYVDPGRAGAPPGGEPGGAGYPANPNGSANDIAGVCSPDGTILGLMPHPEDAVVPEQLPGFHRDERSRAALRFFENGVAYAEQV
jgi:phosphoribosylformylglycinamidine synthase subunit PurQ / glutaminase